MSSACHFPFEKSCGSLVLLGPCVHRELVCSNLFCSSHTVSFWSLKVPTWHHMTKNSLRILKDVPLRYVKMANATRKLPTPWNRAAAQWQRSSSVWKEQGPLRTGLKQVVERSWTHVLSVKFKCFHWKIGVGVLSALLQRLKKWEVSLLVLRPYATLYIKLVCMAVTPGWSLFWRWYTRKPANSLPKTCQQNTWITGTMSYGLMRWRLICLVPMASRICSGDQVRSKR